jgi:hypothetical protein
MARRAAGRAIAFLVSSLALPGKANKVADIWEWRPGVTTSLQMTVKEAVV